MREILYRAKSIGTGEWVYGCYVFQNGKHLIFEKETTMHHYIYERTVGQYTGLTDRNGKKIFKGDIIKNIAGYVYSGSYTCAVVFRYGWFCGEGICVDIPPEQFNYCEVIGNIHDNPELLEVTQ